MHRPEPEAVNTRPWTTHGTRHLQRGTDGRCAQLLPCNGLVFR
ncbi:hypothetical protein OG883_43505 [Streptomyces sp. NBC_01142]|nr:hypothetical protein [Streptomyces sp. NBC_01142]MCX4826507.1 hypothetical protein [Streptomyces sp. NBC_01142]